MNGMGEITPFSHNGPYFPTHSPKKKDHGQTRVSMEQVIEQRVEQKLTANQAPYSHHASPGLIAGESAMLLRCSWFDKCFCKSGLVNNGFSSPPASAKAPQ